MTLDLLNQKSDRLWHCVEDYYCAMCQVIPIWDFRFIVLTYPPTHTHDKVITISYICCIWVGRLERRNDPWASYFNKFATSFNISSGAIECVSTFKLLGIHLDTNLFWSAHINSVTSKASKRLYFLKQLKTEGVPYKQLLHFYTAVIRPVLEYAAPAWHHLINRTQAQHLESV